MSRNPVGLIKLATGAVCMLSLSTVVATIAHAVQPANFQLGPVYVAPSLDVSAGYIDNLFRSADDEVDTWQTIVTPRLEAWMLNGVNSYALTYEGKDYRYDDSSDDNYYDQRFNLDIHHEFNAKNALNAYAQFFDGHEERGTGLTDGFGPLVDKPVEYQRTTYGGDYTYGNLDSDGRLRLEAKTQNYDYQSFRNFTQFRDRDQSTLGGTFFWAVGAKSDVLFQLRYIDNEYDQVDPADPFGAFDSEEYNYLVGMAWDATATLSGSAKVGAYDRSYSSSARQDDDGFQWEVDLTYKPRSYSTITLESGRYSRETNGLGDSNNTEELKLNWAHDWSGRSSTKLGVLLANEDYTGVNRKDERLDFEASYNFAAKRWLDLGLGMRYEDRSSDVNFFEYTRNYYFAEIKLSL